MKTKQQLIKEILQSGAKYIATSVSNESCAIDIAIEDLKNIDDIPLDFWWEERPTGLNKEDY